MNFFTIMSYHQCYNMTLFREDDRMCLLEGNVCAAYAVSDPEHIILVEEWFESVECTCLFKFLVSGFC